MTEQPGAAAPAKTSGMHSRNQIALVAGAVAVVVLLIAVITLWPRRAHPVAAPAAEIGQLAALTQQVDEATRERDALQRQVQNAAADDQALREDLERRNAQLADLQSQVAQSGAAGAEQVIAKEGDRHDRLVMAYLRSKKLGTEEAYRLASQVALTEVLLPGYKVWFLYRNGTFGTWVTQGEAATSPQAHAEYLATLLSRERDAMQKALSDERAEHEQTRLDRDDLRNLSSAADSALRTSQVELGAMASAAERATRDATTVRFAVGSKSMLQKDGIIDGGFRLQPEPRGDAFLLNGPTALPPLDPAAYGLRRIRKVTVVPGTVKPGRDFDVELVDGFARVTIRRPEQFLGFARYFVVVLE